MSDNLSNGDFVKFKDGRPGLMKVLQSGYYCKLLRFNDSRRGYENEGDPNPRNVVYLIPHYHLIKYDDWILNAKLGRNHNEIKVPFNK